MSESEEIFDLRQRPPPDTYREKMLLMFEIAMERLDDIVDLNFGGETAEPFAVGIRTMALDFAIICDMEYLLVCPMCGRFYKRYRIEDPNSGYIPLDWNPGEFLDPDFRKHNPEIYRKRHPD